jgi:hypothetical protein
MADPPLDLAQQAQGVIAAGGWYFLSDAHPTQDVDHLAVAVPAGGQMRGRPGEFARRRTRHPVRQDDAGRGGESDQVYEQVQVSDQPRGGRTAPTLSWSSAP